jgi:nucleotide-binding universal stress UspA family protein
MSTGGTIVCDVTDPPAAGAAAALAGALAGRLRARVVLVAVVGGDAHRRALLDADDLGIQAETRVALGDHAEALARVAAEEGADLVIVGARAVGLGGRNLRCALVRDLEAVTPVPVLVAPPSTRRRSVRRLYLTAGAGTR